MGLGGGLDGYMNKRERERGEKAEEERRGFGNVVTWEASLR